ncbi:hypothetical protein C8A01DRAFT_19701 [Parachaetomium inaequale]|uniref:Uncharacterized protein n=1 Tax=Parachaetomium inaequale TaxID=2588326 RepID=A0AAN6SN37_9PEZI|nr:hypothetical protein C8A01DRAFT_19701 [Parachaetomium inaequale]
MGSYKSGTGIWDPKWKHRWHITLLVLAVLVIILTGVYIGLAPFISRPDIMGIPFAVKTIVIISYELLTEHTRRFAKWRSVKANLILSCIEPVFWLTLIILKFMGISRMCTGGSCGVNWVTVLVVAVILVLSVHVMILSFKEYREVKEFGGSHSTSPSSLPAKDTNDATSIRAASSTAGPSQNTRKRGSQVQTVVATRRSHEKSRTGCRTCKKRRIKASSISASSSHQGRGRGGSAGVSSSLPSQLSSDINMMDLELMHNFTTYTCTTMVSDPAVRQLMRTTAVHMAVDCEYIMRSILAVSALHLSRYRPRNKDLYLERAMQHHQAATSAALALMTDLRAEECERLHLFSMLTVYYALGCPVNEVDLAPESPLIPHWLRLLHGMEPILTMLDPRTYRGVLTPLFDFGRRRMGPFLKSTPPRDPSLLVDIQSLIHRTCTDTHLIPIYDDMIEQVRRMLGLILAPSRGAMDTAVHSYSQINQRHNASQSPSTYAVSPPDPPTPAPAAWTNLEAWDMLVWQWTQGKDFLPLLEAVSPPQEAVVIFAYCLLVVRKLENQWWVEGWADHLMSKTWALLDEEHRHWVVWATEEMGWIPPR